MTDRTRANNEPLLENPAQQTIEPVKESSAPQLSFLKLVLFVNMFCIFFQLTLSIGKELLVVHGVTKFEYVAFRSMFIAAASFVQLKISKIPMSSPKISEQKVRIGLTTVLFVLNNLLMQVSINYLPIAIHTIIW